MKKEHKDKLAEKLTALVKESKVKQAYKSRFMNLINICNNQSSNNSYCQAKSNNTQSK
jgi:hypothetical protein